MAATPARRIVLGVSGGIAAYKACSLLRLLTEDGHDVTVVPTAAALRFVGVATWAALSGRPVATDVWSEVESVPHVRIGQHADLVVVAPATADLLAKAAHGLADDLLTSTLLTARCPVVFAPAMHTEMWDHPATQANIELLLSRGAHVIPPASGRLTGADTGTGRLPDPQELYAACQRLLSGTPGRWAGPGAPGTGQLQPLAGRRVVVTAGGTQEPLDPVRFLGNRSSGKQGHALASVAARRGAEVTLIGANTTLPVEPGVELVRVGTALELQEAVERAGKDADVVVMAAAVADFRPRDCAATKIKKAFAAEPAREESAHGSAEADTPVPGPTIELVRNPDILAGLVQARGSANRPLIVGFAAETGDQHGSVLQHARAKLERKGCDVLVANEVGADKAFGQDSNTVHILRRGTDDVVSAGPAPKVDIAEAVWDGIQELL